MLSTGCGPTALLLMGGVPTCSPFSVVWFGDEYSVEMMIPK